MLPYMAYIRILWEWLAPLLLMKVRHWSNTYPKKTTDTFIRFGQPLPDTPTRKRHRSSALVGTKTACDLGWTWYDRIVHEVSCFGLYHGHSLVVHQKKTVCWLCLFSIYRKVLFLDVFFGSYGLSEIDWAQLYPNPLDLTAHLGYSPFSDRPIAPNCRWILSA